MPRRGRLLDDRPGGHEAPCGLNCRVPTDRDAQKPGPNAAVRFERERQLRRLAGVGRAAEDCALANLDRDAAGAPTGNVNEDEVAGSRIARRCDLRAWPSDGCQTRNDTGSADRGARLELDHGVQVDPPEPAPARYPRKVEPDRERESVDAAGRCEAQVAEAKRRERPRLGT